MDTTLFLWLFAYFLLLLPVVFAISSENVFDIKPTRQDVTQGRRAILRCSLKEEFVDTYTLSWLANGKDVKKGRRHVGADGFLHFDSVDKELDSGEFQCVATKKDRDLEYVTEPVTLNIKWLDVDSVLARFPSENTDILPGSRVVLRCNVTGKPKPQKEDITWRLNGINIQDLPNLRDRIEFSKFRATIEKAQLKIFDGVYSCCASTSSFDVKCSTTNYKLHVRDVSVPVLISPPQDAIVKLNGQATFTCKFDATPPPKIEWRRGRESIRPRRDDSRFTVFPNGTMVINNVKEKHEAEYECTATGSKGNKTSAKASLKIAYIDEISNPENEEEYLDIGSNFEKVCGSPDALPTAQITWTRNNKKIANSATGGSSQRVSVSGQTLVILSIQSSDEGQYQCIASNIAGNVTKTFTFRIKSPPKMRSQLVARTEQEGTDVTLKCLVDAVPEPTYTWHQNIIRLQSDSHFKITGNQLTINSISVKDAAQYKCTAENDQGEVSSTAYIAVDEQLKFDPRPSDTCAEVGIKVEIVCGARGVKNPTVTWTVPSKTSDYDIIDDKHGQSTLVIPNPRQGETWKAFCTASDKDEASVKIPITISVRKKPKIVKKPQSATVFRGTAVRLDCGMDPAVKLNLTKLHWTVQTRNKTVEYTVKNNSDGNQYIIMNNGSFHIKNVSMADTASYTCSYKDCGSEVRATALLDVAVRDGPVSTSVEPGENQDGDSTPQYKKIQTVALAVGGSVAYLILTVTIIVYCRRKKRHRKNKASTSVEAGDGESDSEQKLMPVNGSSKTSNGHMTKNGILLGPVTHLNDDIENLQYDSAKLEKVTVIGHGEFGEVFLSKAPGLFPDLAEDILVMVKELQQEKTKDENHSSNNANASIGEMAQKKSRRLEFNREIRLLYLAKHENVVRLLGVCNKYTNSPTNPDHFITEYLEWGILKLCLQASKEGKLQRFNKHTKMKMCCQIAAGLDHLTKLKVTHQDVATRNCVISSKMMIKISVLNLTKEGFENEYSMHYGRLLPVRWMAPETLLEDKVELKSDVWSFGVTCWEVFTLGTMPYSDLSDESFLEEMSGDHPPTLPALDNSKRITSLISKCCQHGPNSRPEFHQIVKKLQSILGAETKTGESNTATSVTTIETDVTAIETDVDATGPLLSAATSDDGDTKGNEGADVKA